MKKLTYSTYHTTENEDGSTETVTVEGTTIIPDKDLEMFLPIVKAEAYNGEVTVEDIPDTEHEPTAEERIAELEAANAALEDALCEMDAANAERIAAIEDALCEMDMG